MPRAALSSLVFDPLCPVIIDTLPDTERGEATRRVNRVATLDGGAVFNDFGFSEADRTMRLVFRPDSAAHEAAVRRLVETYAQITATTEDGHFLAVPQTFTPGETATLTLLVVRKLSP